MIFAYLVGKGNAPVKKIKDYIIISLQIIAEIILTYTIVKLNMLPGKFIFLIVVIEMLLLAAVFLMLFGKDRHERKWHTSTRRAISTAIAVLTLLVALIANSIAGKVGAAISEITDDDKVTNCIGVYVRADDNAKTIGDILYYDVGYSLAFDKENTLNAIEDIEQKLRKELNKEEYDQTLDVVEAFYNEEIDALILSESYASIIEDQDEYADFAEDTKLVYEYQIETSRDNGRTKRDLNAFVVYISGSDTRSKILDVSRSDVNIMMVVNTNTKEILLVNTPRDYYVPIALKSNVSNKRDKLTHCGIYGIDCSMDTLTNLYDMDIDHYAQINFTGFETLIDAISGVYVESDTAFTSGKYSFSKGMNHLDGEEALAFARDRHHQSGGDNDRGKNQMKIIAAVIDKLSTGTILKNYHEILESLDGMFVTDLTSGDISTLVRKQLSDMKSWDVHSYSVTGTGGSDTTFSMPNTNAYVMYPNNTTVAHATELMNKVLNGDKLTDSDVK